jgi:thiamine biosynthesis protein ThiI
MTTYLLKLGELTLKGKNRRGFEHVLKRNLLAMLPRDDGVRVQTTNGRFFVYCREDSEAQVEDALGHLFGIAGWARARTCEKTVDAVLQACVEEARALHEGGARTFKLEARRTDKSFPLDSYGIRSQGGEVVLDAVEGLRVDVHKPDGIIQVEIRERAYIYGNVHAGLRGLPVGTAGRGILLLSGGIDSPVAGYLMASRGMGIDAIYFHAYPYTSEQARQKVLTIAELLGRYTMGLRVHTVSFTSIQQRIKDRAPEPWLTVLLRMAMMEAAELLARRLRAKCLITGESLSQVASQTVENIACTHSRVRLPVLCPLIGMDKDSIIRIAESIGTYKTSILPYADCCVLFSPPHPVLHGDVEEAKGLYEALDLGSLI